MNRALEKALGILGLCASMSACGSPEPNDPPPESADTTASPDPMLEGDPANPNAIALPFENGWVSRDGNGAGIQGAFYTFSDVTDGGTSSISPEDFSTSGSLSICAQGQAAQVLNGEFGTYWGAAVGLNLHQEVDDDTAYSWNATEMGVTGFAFVVDQLPVGGQLRFNLKATGDTGNYCTAITAPGRNEIRFEDLRKNCWTAEDGAPNYQNLEALHWQFVTNESAGYEFSICISELSALTD